MGSRVFVAGAGFRQAGDVDQFMEQGDGEGARADGQVAGAKVLKGVGQGAGLFGREEGVEGGAGGFVEALGGVEGEEAFDLRFAIYAFSQRSADILVRI